jgi:predicted RNA-binding Zn ribbon-like protein
LESEEAMAGISDAEVKQLHDRATPAAELSTAERAALEAWYARQDAAEGVMLAKAPLAETIEGLRSAVREAVSRLQVVTRQIEALLREHAELLAEQRALLRFLLRRDE